MMDLESLSARLENGNNDPKLSALLARLHPVIRSEQGKTIAQNISPDCASQIEQAASAMQQGDTQRARQLLSAIAGTPEGMALVQKLQAILKG